MSFNFTRSPSTKVSVDTVNSGLVPALNTLWLIGRMAVGGGTAVAGTPQIINNYGDPVAALAECNGYFGANAEATSMVIAAINANKLSNQSSTTYPPIMVLPMLSTDTSAALAGYLANIVTKPMPFVAVAFSSSDSTAMTTIKAHLQTISGDDRGQFGQFGSFGFMATAEASTPATTEGTTAASWNLLIGWLRDSAGAPANSVAQVAAGLAAVCAANGLPFMPLNDIIVGGLVPPVATGDWHTPGDTGTEAIGLTAGLVPLMVAFDGSVRISRTVTTQRTVVGTPDAAYYDLQDYQVLYYYRQNAYAVATRPQYKIAKASDRTLLALKSELIGLAEEFETLQMFQYVKKLTSQFTMTRVAGNRFAAVYNIPVNVIPGFHNKGIALHGTTLFDSFTIG